VTAANLLASGSDPSIAACALPAASGRFRPRRTQERLTDARPPKPADRQAEADRQTASLAGLAIALLLLVAGLFLIRELREKSILEDCILAGHLDCAGPAASR
jgi:hypothetical protein